MSHKLVIKDAIRQIIWRVVSAICWFIVIKIITPYLGPLRYWDYSTILKYFAIRSALADFGLYVIAVKKLWQIQNPKELEDNYWKIVWTRIFTMVIVYVFALILAFFLPAYTNNPYLIRGLPLGMLFSASFMWAWILQLPLQIKRKMEQVSIALILARISQIIILIWTVFWVFPKINFDWNTNSILAFVAIIFSVLASGLVQWIYVLYKSNKLIKLKVKIDINFIKNIIFKNRKYWFSYYLSSFHTLIVIIFLSNFFPTSQWYTYTWIRWVGLALIEIMLIIPSALGNSLLHKIWNYNVEQKKNTFGNFLIMIFWIWWLITINFLIFKNDIINIIGWSDYIWNRTNPWANTILPFLSIVLRLSFIKQVFNYIFVAHEKQNLLFKINLIWVIIWITLGLIIIPKYHLRWWVITQLLLEVLFVGWSIYTAYKQKLLPKINKKITIIISSILLIWLGLGKLTFPITQNWKLFLFSIVILLNITIISLSWPFIKKIAKGLNSE